MKRPIPLLAAVLICVPVHATINPQSHRLEQELDRLALPVNARHIAPVMSCLWFGLALAARTFESPGPIADVIRHLQKVQPLWRDVRGVLGEIVLSGDDTVVQWIARLTPANGGRIDVLMSALRLPGPNWRPKPGVNSEWLPRTARLRFDVAAGDGRSMRQIWTHTTAPAMLMPILTKSLHVHGWKRVGAVHAWNVPARWTRDGEQMDLSLVSCQFGTAIVVRRSRPL
jgi:hypothetical protein